MKHVSLPIKAILFLTLLTALGVSANSIAKDDEKDIKRVSVGESSDRLDCKFESFELVPNFMITPNEWFDIGSSFEGATGKMVIDTSLSYSTDCCNDLVIVIGIIGSPDIISTYYEFRLARDDFGGRNYIPGTESERLYLSRVSENVNLIFLPIDECCVLNCGECAVFDIEFRTVGAGLLPTTPWRKIEISNYSYIPRVEVCCKWKRCTED
jgi:hypothetical protein